MNKKTTRKLVVFFVVQDTIYCFQKCITVDVSQVWKMFHASKMMSSFTGQPFGKKNKEPLVSASQDILFDLSWFLPSLMAQKHDTTDRYGHVDSFVSEVSQQLRSSMLSCMGLLGIHPLEPQYKVTVGNVAWTDFLNCHDSCDFNRLFLSSGHPTGLAVRPSDVAL